MAPILRAGLPNVILIGPGLAQYANTGSSEMNPVPFTQGLITNGADPYIDCWGFHPYDSWGWNTLMPQVISTLRNAGINEPVCLTETGRNTLEYSDQASEVTWRITDAKNRAEIADLYWYSLQDHCSACTTSREDHFGLFYNNWTEKPGAAAYRAAVP
jgi:hypothetical protein